MFIKSREKVKFIEKALFTDKNVAKLKHAKVRGGFKSAVSTLSHFLFISDFYF